jgi:hypothetical protein
MATRKMSDRLSKKEKYRLEDWYWRLDIEILRFCEYMKVIR